MPRLFLGNFEFECELAGTPVSASMARTSLELTPLLASIASDEDFLYLAEPVEPGFFERLAQAGLPRLRVVSSADQVTGRVEACPWGWTTNIRERCRHHGWIGNAPPQQVVSAANSRRFSLQLEQQWQIGLPGSRLIQTVHDLATALQELPAADHRWLLKTEFGMSGRGQFAGIGRRPKNDVVGWLKKRLVDGLCVVFEPWMETIEEAGLQYTIPRSGKPVFDGLAPMIAGPRGAYGGSRFGPDPDSERRWSSTIETGLRAARQLLAEGYFGPLGIDAARYRDADGFERIRPLQDVNARLTMGRLALGLGRLLGEGEQGVWRRIRWRNDDSSQRQQWWNQLQTELPSGVRLVRTSPWTIGGRPVKYGTLAWIAKSREQLREAEQILVSQRTSEDEL